MSCTRIDTDLKFIIGVGHLLQPWVLRMITTYIFWVQSVFLQWLPWVLRMIIYILGSKCIPTMVTLGA